jgi:hypothetical protein
MSADTAYIDGQLYPFLQTVRTGAGRPVLEAAARALSVPGVTVGGGAVNVTSAAGDDLSTTTTAATAAAAAASTAAAAAPIGPKDFPGMVRTALTTGVSNAACRQILTALVHEWTGHHLPPERETGYSAAVRKLVAKHGGAAAAAAFGCDTSTPIDAVDACGYLVGAVRSNRVLEWRRYNSSGPSLQGAPKVGGADETAQPKAADGGGDGKKKRKRRGRRGGGGDKHEDKAQGGDEEEEEEEGSPSAFDIRPSATEGAGASALLPPDQLTRLLCDVAPLPSTKSTEIAQTSDAATLLADLAASVAVAMRAMPPSGSAADAFASAVSEAHISDLGPMERAALGDIAAALRAEYAERRAGACARYSQTLGSLASSTAASLDREALAALAQTDLARVRALIAPRIGAAVESAADAALAAVRGFTKLHLAALTGTVRHRRNDRCEFRLRNMLIPQVPDRGGRVNTFNFDREVGAAVRRADMDLRRKYGHGGDRWGRHGRSGGHGGGGGSGGGGGGGGFGARHADPAAPAMPSAAAVSQAAQGIRSDAGNWGKGRGRGGNGSGAAAAAQQPRGRR